MTDQPGEIPPVAGKPRVSAAVPAMAGKTAWAVKAGRAQGAPLQRALPHSLEAEEFLLSCCLLDGADVVARCLQAGVRAHSFYASAHQEVFAGILGLFVASKPIDVAILAEELKTAKRLDAVGGYAFLTQISGGGGNGHSVPTTAQAGYFIEKVREQALLRDIIRAATSTVEDAYNFSGGIDEFAGGVSQKIMAVTGPESGLPAPVEDEALDARALPEPPMLIEGVFHRGRRVLLLAPSKASKTWTAMHMSAAIASGRPWMGFKTHKAPVLHIDLELPEWDLKKRRNKLRELLELKPGEKLGVTWWALDGHQRSIDELLPLIVARAPHGKFGMIVIEPAYVILGKRDENDNADVTDFMNRLAWLARLSGAAVLCTHHFAKGDASKKEAKDRASGAGAWVRAPDTAITLTPLDEEQGEDCYKMEFIERSMKRHVPVGVQFEYPVFRLKSGLDLNALREAGRPAEYSEKDIVKVLGVDKLTHGQWMKAVGVGKPKHMSERTFNRNLKEAIDGGLVTQNGPIYAAKRAD